MNTSKFAKALLSATFVLALAPSGAYARTIARGPASEPSKNVSDVVEKVRQDDEGITVLFKKSKGSYYLKNNVVGFDKARTKLESSLSTKKPVQVVVEPQELNILEVK